MTRQLQKRKPPRKVTPEYLKNAGLYYLARFSSSCANFRRVMMRKVEKSARFHDTDMAEGEAQVEALIRRFVAVGLLDDTVYAKAKTTSMHRRGSSMRAIRAGLRNKGISDNIIDEVLAVLESEVGNPERKAAIHYARRRRLGPFGADRDRTGRRERDLSAMARAGFGFRDAHLVIDAARAEELEDEI